MMCTTVVEGSYYTYIPECLSLRRNWVPPLPLPHASVAPPLRIHGGGHTPLRRRGWGEPIPTKGQKL